MSYWDDWYAGVLGANKVTSAKIVDGTNELDVTEYIGNENFIFNRGTSEGLLNAFSQDTLTIELNNSTHKFDNFVFKGKKLKIDVQTKDIYEENTYNTDYYNLTIINATFNDDYVSIETVVKNMGDTRMSWYYLGAKSDLDPFTSIEIVYGNAVGFSGITYWNGISGFTNHDLPMPSYHFDWVDYMSSALDSISSNGEVFTQLNQAMGGYAFLDKGSTVPYLNINHFPKTTLNNAVNSYVYGGCFDESLYEEDNLTLQPHTNSEEIDVSSANRLLVWGEDRRNQSLVLVIGGSGTNIDDSYDDKIPIDISEVDSIMLYFASSNDTLDITYELFNTYQTGDNLDGNTDTKDGGSFDIAYKVLDDNVLMSFSINSDYYKPTGVRAILPSWTQSDNEWEMSDKEFCYPNNSSARSGALDLTGNSILKLVIFRSVSTESQYASILSAIYNELNFYSVKFEATIPNNLRFTLGDVVAISSGVMATKFSFVENVNTDIGGATILSNNRGGAE